MLKVLHIDTETTGLDPVKNDVIQIAGIIEINNEIKEEFEFKTRPFNIENADQKALDVHGYTLEQIRGFPDPNTAYQGLQTIFNKYINKFDKKDKFTPVGYGVEFDLNFLKQFFFKNHDNYWGSWVNWKKVDPLYLMYFLNHLGQVDLPDYKLGTVCQYFGIEIKTHDALSDIRATRELLIVIKNILKGAKREEDQGDSEEPVV